jgi:cytochrome c-type biogenesis protein CcmH
MIPAFVLLATLVIPAPLADSPVQDAPAFEPPLPQPEQTAPDPEVEARARAVGSQLRCPVCEALSIQDSPTDMARDMRGVIRDQLAAGRTTEEVKAHFVEAYGEWVLLEPEARGFNLLIYVLPLLAVLSGAGLVYASVRRWSRPSGTQHAG